MFLVTDGTLNGLTKAVVVERREDVDAAIAELVAAGVPRDEVVVNPVGPRIA